MTTLDAIKSMDFPNTPTMVQFLATSLARFMSVNGGGTAPDWSKKSTVARLISSDERIDGAVDNTTLGRFLNPAHPQAPNDETVRAVGTFLMLQEAITRRQVELLSRDDTIRSGHALNDFMRQRASEKLDAFHADLAGHYLGYAHSRHHLLESRLLITHHPDAHIVTGYEVLTLYRIADMNRFLDETDRLDLSRFPNVTRALAAAGGVDRHAHASHAISLAGPGLTTIIMRPFAGGFPSTLNATEIVFDGEDRIKGLRGTRNTGWDAVEAGKSTLPLPPDETAKGFDLARHLATEVEYTKQYAEDIQAMKKRAKPGAAKTVEPKGTMLNFQSYAEDNETDQLNARYLSAKEACGSETEKLLLAFEWGDLAGFRSAILNGADPNVMVNEEPLIFALASSGRAIWVDALTDAEEFDPLATDSVGLYPNHGPGVLARRFACVGGGEMVAEAFAALSQKLLAQENQARQLKS